MKLGMVDLDTSHPKSWLPILREMGHDVTCVYDSGTVFPEGYAREFADEMNVPTVCTSLEEMAQEVDAAIIHSCNWDVHVERARPFVEADVPVLIDKPVVGNIRDADTLVAWADAGKVITGGSSMRYCDETRDFLSKGVAETGTITIAWAGCGVDEFNYGIHAYAHVFGLMGPGCEHVRYLGGNVQDQFELTWQDGRRGIVTVGRTPWLPSYATVVTDKTVVQFQPDTTRIYRALLEHDLPILAREAPSVPMRELLEPELAAMAALLSARNGRIFFALNAFDADNEGYDGDVFARGYREQRLPKYLASRKK
ncbi:MAG TPA: Gfo/Idh/MocA family oxidoreductase [Planctomycetota bacterium]|nr:Gfo/Idh/MocA family oxidoreductase [Planctomycetota bacterium]